MTPEETLLGAILYSTPVAILFKHLYSILDDILKGVQCHQ